MNIFVHAFGLDGIVQYKAAPTAANVPIVDFN